MRCDASSILEIRRSLFSFVCVQVPVNNTTLVESQQQAKMQVLTPSPTHVVDVSETPASLVFLQTFLTWALLRKPLYSKTACKETLPENFSETKQHSLRCLSQLLLPLFSTHVFFFATSHLTHIDRKLHTPQS